MLTIKGSQIMAMCRMASYENLGNLFNQTAAPAVVTAAVTAGFATSDPSPGFGR